MTEKKRKLVAKVYSHSRPDGGTSLMVDRGGIR